MTLRLISFLRRHGYFGRAKIAESHLHHAAKILSSGTYGETEEAISSLNSALEMYPDWEKPLELKAKALLRLKRYKEVVELLHSFLPSLSSSSSSNNNNKKIIRTTDADENDPMECFGEAAIEAEAEASSPSCGKCFCIRSNLLFSFKRKPTSSGGVKAEGGEMPAANGNGGLEWRYLVLGQACYHLGMMEDAMALLCKGKRAASEASRKRSNGIREDDFCCHGSTSIAIIGAMDAASLRKQRRGREAAIRYGIWRRKNQRSKRIEASRDGIGRRKNQGSHGIEANRDGIRRRNQESHGIEAANRDGIRGGEYSPSHHPHPHPPRHHRHGKKIRQSEYSDPCYTADLKLIDSMISNIKLLLRRRSAASIALEAGLYSESVRHLTKLIEGRKTAHHHHHHAPPSFITDCYLHRAIAHQAMGKVVDAIADCNHTLALNPKCAKALSIRASLHELVRSFTECLLDLQQLKMMFEANLRSLSMPASAEAPSSQQQQQQWKLAAQINGSDLDMLSGLEYINSKIIAIRRRLSPGLCMLDARAVLDVPQHCSMEDVEKAYLLISLKHSPEKALCFFAADAGLQDGHSSRDMEMAREEAKASAARLSKLIHKAYTKLLSSIAEEEKEKAKEHKRSRKGICWHQHCDDTGSSKPMAIDGGSFDFDGEDGVTSACIEMGKEEDAVLRMPGAENAEMEGEAVVSNEQGKIDGDIDLSLVLQAFKGLQLFGDLPEDQDQCLLTGPWSLPHPHPHPQPLSVP